jgi:hypothetical protein
VSQSCNPKAVFTLRVGAKFTPAVGLLGVHGHRPAQDHGETVVSEPAEGSISIMQTARP